jgi:tetratricopeptide (TPR) repeat protein
MEYEYRAVDSAYPPFQDTAAACLAHDGPFVLHNYGALGCLESCAKILERGGFVLISDYPHLPFDDTNRIFPWQQYDGSIATGLNFPLLKTHFRDRPGWTWCEPDGEPGVLSFRCLGRELQPVVSDRFRSIFSKASMDELYVFWNEARCHRRDGERQNALCAFEAAFARQQSNWALKSEFANFLLWEAEDAQRALALATSGLEDNPVYPPLWKTAGDCLRLLSRHAEAYAAYRRARELSRLTAESC